MVRQAGMDKLHDEIDNLPLTSLCVRFAVQSQKALISSGLYPYTALQSSKSRVYGHHARKVNRY